MAFSLSESAVDFFFLLVVLTIWLLGLSSAGTPYLPSAPVCVCVCVSVSVYLSVCVSVSVYAEREREGERRKTSFINRSVEDCQLKIIDVSVDVGQ